MGSDRVCWIFIRSLTVRKYGRLDIGFFSLLFTLLLSSVVRAGEMNLPHLKCAITLSKCRIVSGEPVNLCFAFTNTDDDEVFVSVSDGYDIFNLNKKEGRADEELKISILDDRGIEVPRRDLLCRPSSQSRMGPGDLAPGKTAIVEYPLHLRMSTLLDPGQYHITVDSFTINHSYRSHTERDDHLLLTEEHAKRETFSGPSLVLEVESYDEAKLVASYETLIKSARQALNVPCYNAVVLMKDFGIQSPILTILWADGPMAVPYQIQLMYDSQRGFRYWPPAIANTWDNIVRYATLEQVENILDIARHPECRPDSSRRWSSRYTPGIAWAIHQWHSHGSESIKQITRDLAEMLPEDDACSDEIEMGKPPYYDS